MDHYDEKELERHAIKDGEIDPETYSPKRKGCLVVVLGGVGLIIGALQLLGEPVLARQAITRRQTVAQQQQTRRFGGCRVR